MRNKKGEDSPAGPVVKTPRFHRWGLAYSTVGPKKKKRVSTDAFIQNPPAGHGCGTEMRGV